MEIHIHKAFDVSQSCSDDISETATLRHDAGGGVKI